MNRKLFLLCFVAIFAASGPASFAQRQTAVGPGTIPLSPTGVLNGVDMSASGTTGTLSVGVVGGPAMDIFTLNNPPAAGLLAVSTAASSQGNIVFNSSSTVFGAIGITQPGGPFLLNLFGGNTGTTVNFQGPVFATALNVTGTGTVNFNSGTTNILATNFASDGTINLSPNTTVIGALTTTAGAQTGTLVLNGGSILNGAVGGAVGLRSINVVGGNNNAGVTATITGATNSYAFSLGTNTLNIGGALTIANSTSSGVINTTLASPTVFGNIRPVGRQHPAGGTHESRSVARHQRDRSVDGLHPRRYYFQYRPDPAGNGPERHRWSCAPRVRSGPDQSALHVRGGAPRWYRCRSGGNPHDGHPVAGTDRAAAECTFATNAADRHSDRAALARRNDQS
jgi:hypothetical protein